MANTNFRVKNGLTVDGAASIGGNATITGKLTQSSDYGYLGIYNSASPSVTYPTQNQTLAIANNFSGSSAEVNIWNTMNPTTYTGTGIRFQQQLTTSTYRDLMFLKNDGNVGIGTITPAVKLDVNGATALRGAVTITTGSYTYLNNTDNTNQFFIYNVGTTGSTNAALAFVSSTVAERMRIDASGHILPGNNNTQNLGSSGLYWSNLYATNHYGTLQTASQPNITTLGTLGSLSVSNSTVGNWTSSIASGTLGGTTGNQVLMQKLTSNDTNSNILEITETRDSTGVAWTTAATRLQQKIDSTWMGFIQFNGTNNNGGITFGTGTTTTSAVSIAERMRIDASGHVLPALNNTYNLGSSSLKWATMYGVASQANYADLAEKYTADNNYEPGTVLDFGGIDEVTISNTDMSQKIAGIVSTNPGYLMNAELESEFVVTLALTGRVPCKVQGTVSKGDMMVSAGNGYARAEDDPKLGSVIGKALEDFDGDIGVIEVVVGRL